MMRRESASAYGFLAFPLAVIFVFTLVPSVAGLLLSLFVWDGSGWPVFVGTRNFQALAADARFWPALRNTLAYVAGTVPATVVLGFLLAAAVHARWFVGKTLCRTVFFLPTIVAIVAIGFVWRWVLNDQAGLAPSMLRAIGVTPPNLLQEGPWPMISIVVVSIWRGVGFCMVLYLAAMSNVSESLYEAAEVDGASRAESLRYITWPQVAPMTAFLAVTGVIGALQVFDIVLVMTTAEVESGSTNVLNWYVYREFKAGRYGYAATLGAVVFALTLAATLAQLRLMRRSHA
ncbi:MAG TPA: sugar ABC transporter permease [Phycisphaerales bacterium]|nr:sugar ABC transporter permease [Phycisphaerales bacterium]